MPISEAKKRANKKWNDANMEKRYDRIQLVVPKGAKAIVEAHAAACHESVNALVNRLLIQELGITPEQWKNGNDEV